MKPESGQFAYQINFIIANLIWNQYHSQARLALSCISTPWRFGPMDQRTNTLSTDSMMVKVKLKVGNETPPNSIILINFLSLIVLDVI